MKRVPIFPCIVGLHAALAAAALLWALQARFGDPLTAALSPAWDSPWEQGKAAFFPLLAAGPVIWYLAEGGITAADVMLSDLEAGILGQE